MNDQELLVKLRKSHKLKQKDMANYLDISLSKYARIEHNPDKMSLDFFRKILNILKMAPNEYETLKLEESEYLEQYDLYYHSIKEQNPQKIKKLYDYAEKNKDNDIKHKMFYLKLKRMFHEKFQEIVPEITLNELSQFVMQWKKQTYFSAIDLECLMILGIKLEYSDYEYLINLMVFTPIKKEKTRKSLLTQQEYKVNVVHIINNILHVCLENEDYENAEKYFIKLKKYVNLYEVGHFKPLLTYYDIIIPQKKQLRSNDIYNITALITSLLGANLASIAGPLQQELKKMTGDETINDLDTTIHF